MVSFLKRLVVLCLLPASLWAQTKIDLTTQVKSSTLTTNTVPKWTGSTGFGNGCVLDDGTHAVRCDFGYDINSLGKFLWWAPNNTVTGTTVNKMACNDGTGKAIICPFASSTTNDPMGVAVAADGATPGTSGSTGICTIGFCSIIMDNSATAGHYAQSSSTVDGDLSDVGATIPTNGQSYWTIFTGNSGAGTAAVFRNLTSSELNASGVSGGNGKGLQVQINGTAITKPIANLVDGTGITFATGTSGNTTTITPTVTASGGTSWNGITNPTGNQVLAMGTNTSTWTANGQTFASFFFNPSNGGFGFSTDATTGPTPTFASTAPRGFEIRRGTASANTIFTLTYTGASGHPEIDFNNGDPGNNPAGGNIQLSGGTNGHNFNFFTQNAAAGSATASVDRFVIGQDGRICGGSNGVCFSSTLYQFEIDADSSTRGFRLFANGNSIGQIIDNLGTNIGLGIAKNTAPTTAVAASEYEHLGGAEFASNSFRLLGFGYNNGFANTNSPAYIGYQETSTTGQTQGDLVFGTRNVTTDTTPTEQFRITHDALLKTPAKFSTYNGNTLSGSGVASIVYSNDQLAQTSAVTDTTMFTVGGTTSVFRFSGVVGCTTSSAAATATLNLKYTDTSNTAQTVSVTATCTTLGAASEAEITQTIRAKNATVITYGVTIANSPTFDVSPRLEIM